VAQKKNRSYFFWEYGKPPEAVLEVVSNQEGEEDGRKLGLYAQLGILYYIIWDPFHQLSQDRLRIFVLRDKTYVPLENGWLPIVGLGLTVWTGKFEDTKEDWLRWCDQQGQVIPTGAERADQERQRADQERQRADQERQRADQERQTTERLAARLRELGINPDET
jgi:hypothetical protein